MHIHRKYRDIARKIWRDKADRDIHIQRKQIGKGDWERTEGLKEARKLGKCY